MSDNTPDRDAARKHFADCGLTYADIRKDHIRDLQGIIQDHLNRRNALYGDTEMKVNKRFGKSIFTPGGVLKGCMITMRCHYFDSREAITFGTSGFIGFAGWADDKNVAPIVSAFIEWVDTITGKEQTA